MQYCWLSRIFFISLCRFDNQNIQKRMSTSPKKRIASMSPKKRDASTSPKKRSISRSRSRSKSPSQSRSRSRSRFPLILSPLSKNYGVAVETTLLMLTVISELYFQVKDSFDVGINGSSFLG